MAVRLDKPWRSLDAAALASVGGQLGVFELADAASQRIFIGVAGGRSTFGLAGELRAAAERIPAATQFRLEVTTAYSTRYQELLMACLADDGELPSANDPTEAQRLGRLSPL